MASELIAYGLTAVTHYAVVYNATAQVWNTAGTPAYEAVNGANWTDYDVTMTEQSGTGRYKGDAPALATRFEMRRRVGATPAITDPVVWEDALTGLAVGDALEASVQKVLKSVRAQQR